MMPTARAPLPDIWPDLSRATLAWFGAVAVLALTLRIRPLASLRNLDSLVLAAMCVLLVMRDAAGGPEGTYSWTWWGYLGLSVAAGYWAFRGLHLLLRWSPVGVDAPVSPGVRTVLMLVGIILCIHQLVNAPLSAAARDGMVGGLYTTETGKLPYGALPEVAGRSPLLYLANAGAVRLVQPTALDEEGAAHALSWREVADWEPEDWLAGTDLRAARLVNAVLFIGILLGLYVIGRRLADEDGAWLLIALFTLVPLTLEALPRPEILLPGMLVTWAFAFALIPGIGGLFSMFCLVLAGLAWPWAWLFVPVASAWFWRRGWQALGSTVGLAGGVALAVWGLWTLTLPALPRADGALATAGLQPVYDARLVNGDTIELTRREVESEERPTPAATAPLWRRLVTHADAPIRSGNGLKLTFADAGGGPTEQVLFRQIEPAPDARPLLAEQYRKSLRALAPADYLLAAGRTILEATWLLADAEPPERPGAWALWSGGEPESVLWRVAQRVVKGLAGVLAVALGLMIFVSGRIRPRHLLGALLLVGSLALLGSEEGAIANWAWLLPLILAAWALREPLPEQPDRAAVRRRMTVQAGPYAAVRPVAVLERPPVESLPPLDPGPAPRITLDAPAPEQRPGTPPGE
ncbi:MAG: hypothetical protein AB1716_11965 [Planctomycetota bacterium]